jgi:hypothetical protein
MVAVVLILLGDDEVLELLLEEELHIANVAGCPDDGVRANLPETLDVGEACEGAVGGCEMLVLEVGERGSRGWRRRTKIVGSNHHTAIEFERNHRGTSDDGRLCMLVRHQGGEMRVVIGTVDIISGLFPSICGARRQGWRHTRPQASGRWFMAIV